MIEYGTPAARWVVAATVLGSGVAFLDGTVVNVALPAIGRDLHTGVAGLQWTVDAYLVTLTAFVLLGGALGDHFGRRRVFLVGLGAFTVASAASAAAPNVAALVVGRAFQGAGAALLVPGSLAIIASAFASEDRPRAIGAWSGLSGIAGAVGPFVGGWLVGAASWRWVFLVNVPIALVTAVITLRHVPESRAAHREPLDFTGAVLAAVGLGATCWALIESPNGRGASTAMVGALGVAALVAFLVVEARRAHPMLPLRLFRSRQFSGANGTTLAVYGALGAATFLVVLELQLGLGYSPLAAGASLLPITALMLLLSPRAGAFAQRAGARLPMTAGPLLVAVGLLLFAQISPGSRFVTTVLPGAIVLGLGLATTVAPLTSTVLAAVRDDELGVASGVNNAVARLAGLLAVAVLPAVVHLDTTQSPAALTASVADALRIAAVIAVAGGAIAFATIRTQRPVVPTIQAAVAQPCQDPCVAAV